MLTLLGRPVRYCDGITRRSALKVGAFSFGATTLTLADVYAMADYAVPGDLPSFMPYLRTKYRKLPVEDVEKIQAYAARLARKHGIDLTGPAPGEDES